MDIKELAALQGLMTTVQFLKLSDIPLTEEAGADINYSSNLTFGDSSHCLYRISDILKEADFANQSDVELLNDLMEAIGDVFVDLEN